MFGNVFENVPAVHTLEEVRGVFEPALRTHGGPRGFGTQTRQNCPCDVLVGPAYLEFHASDGRGIDMGRHSGQVVVHQEHLDFVGLQQAARHLGLNVVHEARDGD